MDDQFGEGYEKLREAVRRDCNEKGACGCFNPFGCPEPNQRVDDKHCFHAYCDKFVWVVDRAKAYGDLVGLDWRDILTAWEKQRDYWYMNYYQDRNFPLPEKLRVFDTHVDLIAAIKPGRGFRCSQCGAVTTSAYECDTCGWKVYGFFGASKTVYVFCKDKMLLNEIFVPIAWEDENG